MYSREQKFKTPEFCKLRVNDASSGLTEVILFSFIFKVLFFGKDRFRNKSLFLQFQKIALFGVGKSLKLFNKFPTAHHFQRRLRINMNFSSRLMTLYYSIFFTARNFFLFFKLHDIDQIDHSCSEVSPNCLFLFEILNLNGKFEGTHTTSLYNCGSRHYQPRVSVSVKNRAPHWD